MIDLKGLVQKYPECLDNSAKLKSYLMDLYPQDKRDIIVIVSIMECGIAESIKKAKGFVNDLTMSAYCSRLENDYGYSPKFSKECLHKWIDVYYEKLQYKWYANITPNALQIANYQFEQSDLEPLIQASKNEDASAQFVLGNIFDSMHDYERAANYYYLSALQSYAPAEHYLALCFYHGDGVDEDEDECKYWMSQAAMHGDATAALFMGERYDESATEESFLIQDDRLSTFWYYLGAKMGNVNCMHNLAYNLQNGVGIQANNLFARYWYSKAAQHGFQLSLDWQKNNPGFALDTAKIKKFEEKVLKHRTIKFGKYYINDRTKKEPIEWIVCSENDDFMILVSKISLACMPFFDNNEKTGWENSKIRDFLHNEFLEEAFDTDERLRLLPQYSQNELNPVYETESGEHPRDFISIPDTFDLVMRLNLDEWGCSQARAASHLVIVGREFDSWWLRNAGEPGRSHSVFDKYYVNDNYYAYMNCYGKISFRGMGGSTTACGVRPLIFVKK